MTAPKVAIRLGTEGKDDVKRDFREVGEAGDAAANRVARGYERATQDVESALRRQAAAAQKIAAIMPQTAMQMRINDAVGTGSSLQEGSARVSAAAFRELIAEQERYQAISVRIREELDPLWAAQQRYNLSLKEARAAHAAGALSADLLAQKEIALKQALDLVNSAHMGGTVSAGQYKAGMQQLGFQMQDLGVQLSMAAGSGNVMKGVLTALTMQGPQVVSAIALMRGSAGGFIGFLAGPWGAAIMAATSVLTILGSEFLNSGDDAQKAAAKVDRYTASLMRLASIQGKVAEQDLANARLKVEMLRGQRDRLDQQIGTSQGTRAMVQRRGALLDERESVSNELLNAEATAAGAQMAYDNRLKLDAIGVAEKASAKSAKAAESEARRAARSAAREREREAEAAAKAELALRTQRNAWANDQDIGGAARAKLTDAGDKIVERQKAFRAANDDISAGNVLLNVEWDLRGKSRREIEAAVELRRYQLELERNGNDLTAEQVEQLVRAKAAQIAFTNVLDDSNARLMAMRDIGSNVVDTVLNPGNWSSWKNVAMSAINDVVSAMWKLAVINPIQNQISGSTLPTIGSLFGLFGGGRAKNGGSAIGNMYTPAGAMLVGENGPEIVNMPLGAQVMTASDTRRAMASNDNGLQIRVIKGDLFDVEVTRISAGVSAQTVGAAAPIIASGASNGAQQAVSRRNSRRLA